jgi:hypothetical protein
MEKSSKRGKIPQSDWPLIMARYEAGETLASIARTYDCSPPAISYVVSRSRARQPATVAAPPAPSATEPQLIKTAPLEIPVGNGKLPGLAAPTDAAANGQSRAGGAPAQGDAGGQRHDMANPPREANGLHRNGAVERHATLPGLPPRAPLPVHRAPGPQLPPGPTNGDRRTLHLSLASPSHDNSPPPVSEIQPAERPDVGNHTQRPPHNVSPDRFTPAPTAPTAPERNHDSARGFAEMRPIPYQGAIRGGEADGAKRTNANGPFIDKELRARVDGDIAAFLAAFDAALTEDTQQSRSDLREATDRLLRAGARTRIELERLEARMPLSPRDGSGRGEAAWRHR